MRSAFDLVSITALPGRLTTFSQESLPLARATIGLVGSVSLAVPVSAPNERAVDEEAEEDDDASEPEIIVPPTEPLETTSDFDEDDFDDDFDDDFEEEFEDDEFDSEVTPEDLEASDDTADPFDDD